MIVSEAAQGTHDWIVARLGKPTGSNAHKFVTDAGKLRMARTGDGMAQGAETYLNELLAEWLIGESVDGESNAYMQRGTELEDEAAAWYGFTHGVSTETIGFCMTDCGQFGASPDRLVTGDGLLEIKTPGIVQHVANVREMTTDYDVQCQCQMFVTGRKWVDLLSYNPAITPVVRRIERDPIFMLNFQESLFGDDGFVGRLEEEKRKLIERGYKPAEFVEYVNPLDPDPTVDIMEVLSR